MKATEVKQELVNAAKIHQMPQLNKLTGISIEWLAVWFEVEMFYGDIQQTETREELLLRLQALYNLTVKCTE